MIQKLLRRLRRPRGGSGWSYLNPEDLRGWTPPNEPVITAQDEDWLRWQLDRAAKEAKRG